MRIKGKFFDKIVSSLLKKYIKKNFDVEPGCLAITNLDASLGTNLKVTASIEMIFGEKDTTKIKDELLKKIF